MNVSAISRAEGSRVAELVALGLEFARSHGLDYAKRLIEQMGADERAFRLLDELIAAERRGSP